MRPHQDHTPRRARLLLVVLTASLAASVTGFAQQANRTATRFGKYSVVSLKADLSGLSANQRKMLPLLIDAAKQMDVIFWRQAYGNSRVLMNSLEDNQLKRFVRINYGPWDRLDGNRPFIEGTQPKPAGAGFYPPGMTRADFEAYVDEHPKQAESLRSLYTIVRRNADGRLFGVPYHAMFRGPTEIAARKLEEAAELAENEGFGRYLRARAAALRSDDYLESDKLWMDMKTNQIDVVIGPIETYEDQLFGYKAAHECYVLLKDMAWSERLSKYAALLPGLQKALPVEPRYKQETPGLNSDLNAYDVIYYAGDCNAGSKTIAINLPNDERVQLEKGTRRLQLKNAMQAKFDRILVPLSRRLLVPEQQKHITFNAFFSNTMFHEVAHGLGIKYTLKGNGQTVRDALRENASSLEEGKADILGLFMLTQLYESGEVTEGELMDYYVTFMTSIFRSVRFGASSAHGRANMIRFNFFKERGAFTRGEDGRYRISMDRMKTAMTELTGVLLKLQGDGDYEAARDFVQKMGFVGPELQADLDRLRDEGIPVDIVFQQGTDVLGL